jgi:tRNA (cmo5U34)-methyltransferase
MNKEARSSFFQQIADQLNPGGILASSDLSADVNSKEYEALLRVWQNIMTLADASAEALERMKAAYAKDVAVLPPTTITSIIKAGGFETPVQFFQAGLIHAWFSRREPSK